MNFYNRKIQYYKSFKLIDSDGDGIKDTMVYSPISNYYYLQFGLEQDIKDIGYYFGDNSNDDGFEILSLDSFWFKKSYINDTTTNSNVSVAVKSASTFSFCNDPEASNYNPSLIGVVGYSPCQNNECCTYNKVKSYTKTKISETEENLDCLVFYTDWGPWNDELILNDTKQNHIKKIDCTFSLRLINQLETENQFVEGGWYGASIQIEVDNGLGYKILEPGDPMIYNIEGDITFNQEIKTFTLDNKVRIWKASSNTNPNKYFTTKPYRDITFKAVNNSKIRVTYFNSNTNVTNYEKYAKYLRLQVIKGYVPVTKQTPPLTTTMLSGYTWAQNLPNIVSFLGNPLDRQGGGETFHYISNGDVQTKYDTWQNYLNGYETPTTLVPWGPSYSEIEVGTFYTNPNVRILDDYGSDKETPIITELNYYGNPLEIINEYNFVCEIKDNYISFFDRNGDGLIESGDKGSVDEGLFSKTRYDSPYIFIKPGTKDGTEPLNDNQLTTVPPQDNTTLIGLSSSGGWRNYAYVATQTINILTNTTNYSYRNVSPTCQLGGVNNLTNTDENLVDTSNANLFLQQTNVDDNNLSADFGNGIKVPHLWNSGFTNAKGGCCSKKYESSLDISNYGPYYNSKCFNCHTQMTARSAQPVLDNTTRISMQTTDSDIYYGPFYDSKNPSYNGYGLAFSKANKFCREIKNKNGVQIINSEPGVDTDELFMGGILHGGGIHYIPNTELSDSYGVTKSIQLGFDEILPTEANTSCVSGTKIPLKCTRVVNDPNCPKNNCMKCVFCFKCSLEDKQSGVFTGNNSDLNGPTYGIKYSE